MRALPKDLMRAAMAAALAFALGWALAPNPAPPDDLVLVGRGDWNLPSIPAKGDPMAAIGRVAAAPFWGPAQASSAQADPIIDPRWRVAAIFGAGDARRLRVEFVDASKPALTLKVGDKLPSGHLVTDISERTYCVQIGSQSFVLGVEQIEPR